MFVLSTLRSTVAFLLFSTVSDYINTLTMLILPRGEYPRNTRLFISFARLCTTLCSILYYTYEYLHFPPLPHRFLISIYRYSLQSVFFKFCIEKNHKRKAKEKSVFPIHLFIYLQFHLNLPTFSIYICFTVICIAHRLTDFSFAHSCELISSSLHL